VHFVTNNSAKQHHDDDAIAEQGLKELLGRITQASGQGRCVSHHCIISDMMTPPFA
jgi:hypothetical protein